MKEQREGREGKEEGKERMSNTLLHNARWNTVCQVLQEKDSVLFFKKTLLFILPTSLINHLHLTHPST